MKKFVNGRYVELTVQEIATIKEERERIEKEAASRAPTIEERLEKMEKLFSKFQALLGVKDE